MNWRVEVLGNSLGSHAADWDGLNRREFGHHPMLDSYIVSSMLGHFGGAQNFMCTLRRNGQVAGMCILQRDGPLKWRSFTPPQSALGLSLISDNDDVAGLYEALPGATNAIDFLRFDPRHGRLYLYGSSPVLWTRYGVTIDIPLAGGFEAYWQRRPKKLRENLRRHLRHARSAGIDPVLRIRSQPEDMQSAVARYAALEGKGWKAARGTALDSNGAQLDFYQDLMRHHAALGQAHVYELWAGDKLAASRLIVAQEGIVVALKTTFDESQRAWAPGRLLLHDTLEDAFSRWPGQSFEFYTSASIDQLSWAERQRSILHVTLFPDLLRAAVGRLWNGFKWCLTLAPPTPGGTESLDATRVYRDHRELPKSSLDLMAAAEAIDVEFGWDWLDLYMRTVMRGSEGLRLITLHRGPLAVAVLPLNVDPALRRLGGSVGALSNFYTTQWGLTLAPEVVGPDLLPMLRALRGDDARPASLRFAPMDPQSHAYRMLHKALDIAGYAVFQYFAHGNWYLPVQGDWADYLAARHGSLRSTIKRMRKRLLADGATIEIATTQEALPRAMQGYQMVYASSWKKPEPVADFLPELGRLCARRGWMRLGVVWLEGKPIAAQFWIVANGRAAIYKVAYDEAYKHYAVGTVLTAALMQHIIDVDRVREVDYLIGDDSYKKRWMTHRRERRGIAAHDLWMVRGLAAAARAWLSAVKHRLLGTREPLAASAPEADDGPASVNPGAAAPTAQGRP